MFARKLLISRAVVALLFAAGCVLAYVLSLELPAATLEPIGPAAFPRIVAAILLVLSLATLWLSFERSPAPRAEDAEARRERPGLTVGSLALLIVYIAVMDYGLLGYRTATVAYLFLFGVVLLGLRPIRIAAAAAIAVAVAFGTHFLFTRFMYIDLPQ